MNEEHQVISICMDHCLSIDEGFRDALQMVRNNFFETKHAVYHREDMDLQLPVTVIIDVSWAPDHVLRNADKIDPPGEKVNE